MDQPKGKEGEAEAREKLAWLLGLSPGGGSNNVNTIRIEGAGSIWNGIAIGIALGAVIAGSVAVMASLQQMNLRVQQAEAFQAALYMVSPRLGKEIDEELDKKEARKEAP